MILFTYNDQSKLEENNALNFIFLYFFIIFLSLFSKYEIQKVIDLKQK